VEEILPFEVKAFEDQNKNMTNYDKSGIKIPLKWKQNRYSTGFHDCGKHFEMY
jgi:hypothetical protein